MTRPHWYLPLADEFCEHLADGSPLEPASLPAHATAALLFVLQLPKLAVRKPLEMQRQFANLLNFPAQTLSATLVKAFDPTALAAGLAQAKALNIGLLDSATVALRPFLHADGRWDFGFPERHWQAGGALQHDHQRPGGLVIRLSDHQLRLVQTIRENREDSIEAQAHAGTGKTFVLGEVLALMPQGKCLFLADTELKLETIRARFGNRVWTSTFKQLAERFLAGGDKHLQAQLNAAAARSVSYAAIAELAGLGDIGNRKPPQVAALCWRVVAKFCASNDRQITTRHIPQDQLSWLSAAHQQLLALAAQQLWFRMTRPDPEQQPLPVRGYHRVKQMVLAGHRLSEQIKTVIIDEGHDLTAPMVEFLDQSPQTVITLGDRFQNLQGWSVSHAATIRHSEMSLSLRCGPQLMDYVNPLIAAFPGASALPFVADKARETVVRHYPPQQFPDQPAVMLVADEWGLFDWLVRSRETDQGAAVIDWNGEFESFLDGCLGLYKGDQPPRHGAIARYRTWEQLRAVMGWNEAFVRVEQWLERVGTRIGVSGLYQGATLAEFAGGAPGRPLLATVFTAKNFELSSLAISEDLYYFSDLRGATALSRKLALLYTAITRASGQVYVPDTHQERLDTLLAASRAT